MSEVVTKDALYPLGDWVSGAQPTPQHHFRARWTGSVGLPRRGQWYLSGAEITAYRAANDLSTIYALARVVEVEVITVTRVVRVVEEA